jgi:hypothetical protein
VERRKGSVARTQRPLNVAELSQKLADARLGFHFEDGQRADASDVRRLSGHGDPSSEPPLVEVVSRGAQEPKAHGPRRSEVPSHRA